MASAVGICNRALRKIGASTITSLTQGVKNANFCNNVYAELRNALLEMHPWNFAVKTAQLAQTATTPTLKYDYAYALPSDFIRAITVHDSNEGYGIVDHQIRNGVVEATASQVWMTYIAEITDPNEMSPLFREALSSLIAVDAASAIAESATMREQMQKQFEKDLRRARSSDSQGNLPDRQPIGSWVSTRTGRLAERKWSW